MKTKTALKAIFFISLGGLLFSGYLSYMELWGGGCQNSFVECGSTFSLFSLPACVYGFFMYLTVFTLSALGLRGRD
ncbi:hypothetical protein A2774_05685 [Candidatus Roizmanbacteria bacterium RIFCSPHIGHO2_01_FULL_39_12c]|uniref:Vitamin K epoxide reductase domain-containing protein n=1 Tax=Candidatus Roizmanbacteria bacterium RIFCSPHIGHO2_01_FULL_39_12c TaxID=1802031 RepID=A0A1F7G8A1_9BACT|nr:MAG: hypothetical protein A2774_05685 [Candidatus Roizmanbacteria bacterium RIFCSPHIGHO2_01_FULL_39_12c]